jgi:hypothetical protein
VGGCPALSMAPIANATRRRTPRRSPPSTGTSARLGPTDWSKSYCPTRIILSHRIRGRQGSRSPCLRRARRQPEVRPKDGLRSQNYPRVHFAYLRPLALGLRCAVQCSRRGVSQLIPPASGLIASASVLLRGNSLACARNKPSVYGAVELSVPVRQAKLTRSCR